MNSIESFLERSILKHIALEFTYDNIICEKFGEYDGCKELQEYIYKKLKSNNYNKLYKSILNI